MFDIKYEDIDARYRNTVKIIEEKSHVRYIRYLFTKRYAPAVIKKELCRLGLSAPHEPNLIAYYMCIIDPIVKAFGVGPLYADYKNRLLRDGNTRGDYSKEILNYRLHLDGDLDMQVKFNKFVKYIEVGDLWVNEIYKFHGNAQRMPVDETGTRILDSSAVFKIVEKILLHPKRFLIDKMILENVPDTRIAEYFTEKVSFKINRYDVACYKKAFFNVKTQSIEERIQSLEAEKASLAQLLEDLDNPEGPFEMEMGEALLIRRQTESRIEELNDNIKTMNMMYSDYAFQSAIQNQNDYLGMFSDIVTRGYQRFTHLDAFKDRDVVDPLVKTAKMMSFAYDKVESIKAMSGAKGSGVSDVHSQQIIMELYKQRMEDIAKDQIARSNKELGDLGLEGLDPTINPNLISGIEELGVNIEGMEKEDE